VISGPIGFDFSLLAAKLRVGLLIITNIDGLFILVCPVISHIHIPVYF